MEIKHFDLCVHMGHARKSKPFKEISPEDEARFGGLTQRIQYLSQDPQSLLLFFSAYLDRDKSGNLVKDKKVKDMRVFAEELKRLEFCIEQLGNRFYYFPGWELPAPDHLKALLKERGFAYNPKEATLTAYGEYYEACVWSWWTGITLALGVEQVHSTRNPNLSLSLSAADQGRRFFFTLGFTNPDYQL